MVPLEQKTIKILNSLNHEEEIPSLDPTRVEKRHFVKYLPPPLERQQGDGVSSAEMDALVLDWKERMMFIYEDLNWLLRLPHDLFWCQAIFDDTLQSCVDSFLQFAPRYFDKIIHSSRCKEVQNKISKLMFLTILRLCSDQESEENFISSDVYGEILYENFLFDVPKIMDICSLFCGSSKETRDLLSKAIGNIFQKQPRYLDDLDATVVSLLETLNVIGQKLGLIDHSDEPKELPLADTKSLSSGELQDMILYLYDTGHTLVAFLDIFGNGAQCFLNREVIQKLVVIIENYIPTLEQHLKSCCQVDDSYYLKQTTKCFVKVCHIIMLQCFVKKAEESSSKNIKHHLLEDYIQIMTSLLSYTRFLRLYEKRHGVSKDFEAFKSSNSYVNEESVQYILSAVESMKIEDQSKKTNNYVEEESTCEGATASLSEETILDGIRQVRELFPRLKNEFVRACIVHFDGKGQEVINNLLEDNLPVFLKDLKDEYHGSIQSESMKDPYKELPIDKIGGNYYMKGKHVTKAEQRSIMDDKSASAYVKDRVNSEIGMEEYLQEKGYLYDEYDDEYDDTYDSLNVGAMDADSRDDLKDMTQRRSFVVPRVLQVFEGDDSSEEHDSDEKENDDNNEDNGSNQQPRFIENRGRGQRGRGGGRGRGEQRGRGAGPNNTTKRASSGRAIKAKKHNHKNMAAKKFSRGMGPI